MQDEMQNGIQDDMRDEMQAMEELFDKLYPLCRSITGEGLRQSLEYIKAYMPLDRLCFKTGEQVLNWTIPEEWVIREAWVKNEQGEKVIDFKEHNLHLVNYSIPIDKKMSLEELKPYIHTIPHIPTAIPYVTSYYDRRWGFCMAHEKYMALEEGTYHVYIDSEHRQGQLDIGEAVLEGEGEKEVFLSSYLCHPSMANNELSGPIVLAMLYNRIKKWPTRHLTYRFVLNPETIGSISYLSKRGEHLKKHMHTGLVLTCLGGDTGLNYKCSRKQETPINEMITHLNTYGALGCQVRPFTPINGSDERQYCSPGFNLPVGQLSRLTYVSYWQYHTSLDNKELMGIENLKKSVDELEMILKGIDLDGYYLNTHPYGEVKLGDYDLYPTLGSRDSWGKTSEYLVDGRKLLDSILTILNYSDGTHKLSEIASRLGTNVLQLEGVMTLLKEKGLLEGPYFEKELRV